MRKDLEDKIKMLPESPGVYVMLGLDGGIIYIGKAKVLKNRVKQYFYSNKKPEKVQAMVSNIADFYYIITQSEIDALSLENNLIKKHKPRYNILLKDDKTYPYIRVNLKETFPSFSVTRKIKRDGARYFGPYMGGVNVKDTLEIVNVAFGLRPCKYILDEKKLRKPCLNYHIKKCVAPCAGYCTAKEYREKVNSAIDFLSGNDDFVESLLKEKMRIFAEKEEFELALSFREKLKMLEKIKLKRITSLNKFVDIDVIAVSSNGIYGSANMLYIRGGRMQGGRNFPFDDAEESDADRLSEFISRYYLAGAEIPDEILVPEEFLGSEAVEGYIKSAFGKSVRICTAERGVKRQLLDMAKKNADDYLEKEVDKIKHRDDMTKTACLKLKEVLGLKNYPRRMECYDISHISGVDKVGSMVVFIDGEADKSSYRRFKIKTVEGSDDFACLKEVLKRRLSKLGTEEEEKFPRPDLIVIDGGKGQLSAVKEILEDGCSDIDLISLAKKEEEIFTEKSSEPIVLPRRDYTLRMLQRIRDEAHRFAITYHKATHIKTNLASELDGIAGIGKIRKKALLNAFGSVENLKRADREEILKVEGIGEKHLKAIEEYFKNEKKDD